MGIFQSCDGHYEWKSTERAVFLRRKFMGLDRPIVLATRNEGKIREYRDLFSRLNVTIKGLEDFGSIPDVEEDGKTFEENAVKKALETAKSVGLPAMADDSGLVVKSLGGLPGVRSARYAGEGAGDEQNNAKLLEAMRGKRQRQASFICVIALAVPSGQTLLFKGRCDGVIAEKCKGRGGFGYDPVFYFPPMGKTFAQLSRPEKNRVSHRRKAMLQLESEFDIIKNLINKYLSQERN
jgi:XTP/dITP diphosphohydrolase